MELTPQDLIAAALAEPADSHERWKQVSLLHRRGDEATFQAAVELLDSPAAGRRVLAADILGQLGADAGVSVAARPFRRPAGEQLVARLDSEKDPEVLRSIATALSHLNEGRAVAGLHALRRHPDPRLRRAVVLGLTGLDDDLAVSTLIELSDDSEAEVRDWATFGLGAQLERDDDPIRGALLARVDDSDDDTRAERCGVSPAGATDGRSHRYSPNSTARRDSMIHPSSTSRCSPSLRKPQISDCATSSSNADDPGKRSSRPTTWQIN